MGVQNALKRKLVGAYLVGSLATGDFDLDSDIDFLIVTDAELSDEELRLLQALHIEIHDLDYYPAKHLEGSYISRAVLIEADLVGVQPLWYVDNGSSLGASKRRISLRHARFCSSRLVHHHGDRRSAALCGRSGLRERKWQPPK